MTGTCVDLTGVKGDGRHDDTAGLQRALDTRLGAVYLPPPAAAYTINRPLVIHSGQTLVLDRTSVVRLADGANVIADNFSGIEDMVSVNRNTKSCA